MTGELLEAIDSQIAEHTVTRDELLEQLHQQQEDLERLATMRELATLLGGQNPPVATKPNGNGHRRQKAAPATPPAQTRHRRSRSRAAKPDERTATGDVIVGFLEQAEGPVPPAVLRERLGLDGKQLSYELKKLRAAGRVVAAGATKARTYAIAGAHPAEPAPAISPARPSALAIRDVNLTIANDPGLTESQLVQALDDYAADEIAGALDKLIERGWIVKGAAGSYAPTDDSDSRGGGVVKGDAPSRGAEGLACAECRTQLREPSATGLCGLCEV